MNKLSAALGSAVECPVCLLVPMEGTVPCCPSGHITCSPCLEGWRREGKEECPTCRVPMGEGKSLLAKVVIENMEHECRMEGCKEMVAHRDYRRHQEACTYRLVICPGSNTSCTKMLPFCEVEEHVQTCKDVEGAPFGEDCLSVEFTMPETGLQNMKLNICYKSCQLEIKIVVKSC